MVWPKHGWPSQEGDGFAHGPEALFEVLSEITGLPIALPPLDVTDQNDDRRFLVVHPDFSEGVILAYEAAVANGLADSADAFTQFASAAFTEYRAFRENLTIPDVATQLSQINLSQLRHDPKAALAPALARLAPEHFADPALDDDLIARIKTAARPVLDISNPTTFRHHDPELFARLARLQLPRDVVMLTFREVMKRDAKDSDILFFQGMPSVERIRDALTRSSEYIARNGLPEKDVRLGYRFLLDRDPSATELNKMRETHFDLSGLRSAILMQPEFDTKYQAVKGKKETVTVPQAPTIPGEPVVFGAMPQLQPCTTKRVIFLHIPKCGGTTLHHMLGQWYGTENMHPERFNGLYRYAAAQLASKLVFSGHFDYYSTTLVPGPKQLISFLRDPVDRLVSLYNFHRAHNSAAIKRGNLQLPRWANEHDIDDYFAHSKIRAHPAVDNSITRYFSDIPQIATPMENPALREVTLDEMLEQALRNLEKFAFVGFMDRYDEDIERLAETLDRPAPSELCRHQVLDDLMETSPDMRKIEKQRPAPETRAGMEELVRYDRLFYARAREIFA